MGAGIHWSPTTNRANVVHLRMSVSVTGVMQNFVTNRTTQSSMHMQTSTVRSVFPNPHPSFYSTLSTTVLPTIAHSSDHHPMKSYQSTTAELPSSIGVAIVHPVPRPSTDGLIGDSDLGFGGVDMPDNDERRPSSSSSTSPMRSVSLSRSLGLVLGLVACITAVVTMSIVVLVVYRYRAAANPSRRASLVSVTSLGYTKAPTTESTTHTANVTQMHKPAATEPLVHNYPVTGSRRPASSASSAFSGGGGCLAENMTARNDFMGPPIIRTSYGIGEDAYMTSTMTRGNNSGGGCKTSHAKEWFV